MDGQAVRYLGLQPTQRAFKHKSDPQNHAMNPKLTIHELLKSTYFWLILFAFRYHITSIFSRFFSATTLSLPIIFFFKSRENWDPDLKKPKKCNLEKSISCDETCACTAGLAVGPGGMADRSWKDRADLTTPSFFFFFFFRRMWRITHYLYNWWGRALKTCELECVCQKCWVLWEIRHHLTQQVLLPDPWHTDN